MSRPQRQDLWMTAAITLAATAMLVVTCASCRAPAPGYAGAERTRSPIEQYAASVAIFARCPAPAGTELEDEPIGSGVVVSPTLALTARHVVDVPGCTFVAVEPDGTAHATTIDINEPGADLARLRLLPGDTFRAGAVDVGERPAIGDVVCVVGRVPFPTRFCGVTMQPRDEPGAAHDIRHAVITQPGNSGGPIYDARGRLVGIATQLYRCSSGQLCGGNGTSLHSRRWIVAGNARP